MNNIEYTLTKENANFLLELNSSLKLNGFYNFPIISISNILNNLDPEFIRVRILDNICNINFNSKWYNISIEFKDKNKYLLMCDSMHISNIGISILEDDEEIYKYIKKTVLTKEETYIKDILE